MNPLDITAAGVCGEFKSLACHALTTLTPRELAVLKIASDGKTAEEVASALGVRMETVRPLQEGENKAEGPQPHACRG